MKEHEEQLRAISSLITTYIVAVGIPLLVAMAVGTVGIMLAGLARIAWAWGRGG